MASRSWICGGNWALCCDAMRSSGWQFQETMRERYSQKERDACAVRYSMLAIVDATRNRKEKNSLTLLKWDRCAVKLECWGFIAKLLRITDSYWEYKSDTGSRFAIYVNVYVYLKIEIMGVCFQNYLNLLSHIINAKSFCFSILFIRPSKFHHSFKIHHFPFHCSER